MKLGRVIQVLEAKPISKQIDPEIEVDSGFAADLMSDVLMCAQEGTLLLTGIINPQVVRTAEMVSSRAIVFVRCKIPLAETVALAEEKDIVLLACKFTMFESCARLFNEGLCNCDLPEPTVQQWHKAFDKN